MIVDQWRRTLFSEREVCERLQEQIWAFRRMQAAGWELTDEILDDYGFMEKRPREPTSLGR